jgi:DNA-binding transcriptional LysR family regulator
MDLDLVLVRAFVTVVDEAHFGRAAEVLSVSQQAVSKRVARLEAQLGSRLLTRDASGVALTAAGHRFLGPARKTLAAGDLAAAAARREERPLRIDVWGHLFAADVPVGDLAHRLVRLEPVDAILAPRHPLANHDELRPADLRGSTLVSPAPANRLDFLVRFADQFGISDWSEGPNLGFGHFIDRVSADPRCFSLLPADVPLPDGIAIRTVPLVDPTPLYAWSLIWRRDDHHPRLPELAEAFADAGRASRWLEYRPSADWLPEPDRAQAHNLSSERPEFS